MILGIDPASTSGWSLPDQAGQWTTKGNRLEKFVQFEKHLALMLDGNSGVDLIVYETPFCRGPAATRVLWGLAAIIEKCAAERGIQCADYPPKTFKAWFCGHGNASKEDVIEMAQMMGYKIPKSNDHMADAVAIRLYGEAHLA